jgi:hypothetical protein
MPFVQAAHSRNQTNFMAFVAEFPDPPTKLGDRPNGFNAAGHILTF